PARLELAQRQRAVGDGVGERRPRLAELRALADRGAAPADVLRLGARCRLPRAAGLEPVPPFPARRRSATGLPARHLHRRGLTPWGGAARRRPKAWSSSGASGCG